MNETLSSYNRTPTVESNRFMCGSWKEPCHGAKRSKRYRTYPSHLSDLLVQHNRTSNSRRGEMTRTRVLLSLALALLTTGETQARPAGTVAPALPTQFRADVVMTSHLTEPAQAYPPSVREMAIQYDFEQRIARAEVRKGHDQGKVFVRRYDTVRSARGGLCRRTPRRLKCSLSVCVHVPCSNASTWSSATSTGSASARTWATRCPHPRSRSRSASW